MKLKQPCRFSISLLVLLFFAGIYPQTAEAQRGVTYQELRNQAERPNIYTDHLSLPSESGDPLLIYTFRIDYDLLPFRRSQTDRERPSDEHEFFSSVRLNLEILRSQNPVARETWSGTAWTRTFDETRSRTNHLEGYIASRLSPGEYRLRPQLERSESATPRQAAAPRSRRDRDREEARASDRTVTVPNFESHATGQMILLENHDRSGDHVEARLFNFGSAARYGEDYELLILLPADTGDETSFDLQIHRMRSGSDRETQGDPLFETTIEADDLIHTEGFRMDDDRPNAPTLSFDTSDDGWRVAILSIPKSNFPNTATLVALTGSENGTTYASRVIQSRWIGMPASLYNLEIAINKLRFMIGEDEARRMQRGSASDRERRFREFWSERDPTPDTDYNELMVEYYNRIDRAYDMFTTPERAGYESDMGRALILYGEPGNRERRYPTGSPTREVWTYPDRTLIFQATSGFGDFRLVSEES